MSDYYHDDPVEEEKSGRFSSKFITSAVVIFASVFYFQSTLAGNISINSSRSIEFGQSVSVTAACSGASSLTVTPKSSFVNAANGTGSHYLSTVQVTGIPASCNGKDFSISFYDSATGSSALPIFSFFGDNKSIATVYSSAGYFLQGFQSSGTDVSNASGAFTVTFKTPVALSTNTMKVTLQSNEHKDWAEASISSQSYFSCTLMNSSGVKCWGVGDNGKLGNGATSNSSTPVTPTGLSSGVSAIKVGWSHACAVLNTGTLKCWGANSNGQLGDGTTTSSLTPLTVPGLSSAVSDVAATEISTCALLRTGAVQCWGGNTDGQAGNSTATDRPSPVDIALSSGASAIASGRYHTCAVLITGGVQCWGKGTKGQLGNGSASSATPVSVTNLSASIIAIAAGIEHTCALLITGGVQCWGLNTSGQLGASGITNAVAISAGGDTSCALLSTGAVKCWGQGNYGQLGNGGTPTYSNTPVDVTVLNGATAIAIDSGWEHGCAVLKTGAVQCWGGNGFGQLGAGSPTITGIP